MVFYFTATGNSLYAARQLDTNIMSIPQVMRCGCLRLAFGHIENNCFPIYNLSLRKLLFPANQPV